MAARSPKESKKRTRRAKASPRSADQPPKARRFFRARVRRTPGAETVLRHLDAIGRICLDHLVDDNEGFHVELSEPEIEILREEAGA